MLLNNKDKAYIWDIIDACADIQQFIEKVDYEQFQANKLIRFAVERQLLVVGEAANHLSDDFKNSTKTISWKSMI